MEEFLATYGNELALGGSGSIATAVIAFLKAFNNRLRKMEERLAELEKDLHVNTMLDKERAKK